MRATPNNATSSFSRLYSVCAIKAATYRFFTTSFNGSTVNRETFRSFQVVPDNVRALVQRPIRYLSPVSSPSKVIQANETCKFEATVVSSSSKISSVGFVHRSSSSSRGISAMRAIKSSGHPREAFTKRKTRFQSREGFP